MKPPPFRYEAPGTFADAVRLIAEAGGGAVALAGGQSLIPLLRYRLVRPDVVVDLRDVSTGRDIVEADGGVVELGAMVTHRAADRWAAEHGHHVLTEAVAQIGNPAVRTMGTVVGSLAHADPSAEWAAIALALEGSLLVVGTAGERRVPAAELFDGPYTTTLAPDELVMSVRLVMPGPRSGAAFVEVAERRGDPALAGAAVRVRLGERGTIDQAAVGLIGLGPIPLRSPAVEGALIGSSPDEVGDEAAAAVRSDIAPLSDGDGSAAYRRRVAPVVVGRAIRLAVRRAVEAER